MTIRNRKPQTEVGIHPLFQLNADQIKQIPTREFNRDSLPKDPSDVSTDRESLIKCIELGRQEFNGATAIFKEMVVRTPDETLLEVAKLMKTLEESILSDTQTWEELNDEGTTPKLFGFYAGLPNAVASEDGQKLSIPVADRASLLTYLDDDSVLEAIWEAHDHDLNLPEDWEFADIQLEPQPESKLAKIEPFYQPLSESALFEILHKKLSDSHTDPIQALKSVIQEAPVDTLMPIILSLQQNYPGHDSDGDEYFVLQQPISDRIDMSYSTESGIITFDIDIDVIRTELLYSLHFNPGFIDQIVLWQEYDLWAARRAPEQ